MRRISPKKTRLEIIIIDELVKMGINELLPEHYDSWHWLEKEIEFDEKKYLVGAYLRRDAVTRALEIYGQEYLQRN